MLEKYEPSTMSPLQAANMLLHASWHLSKPAENKPDKAQGQAIGLIRCAMERTIRDIRASDYAR